MSRPVVALRSLLAVVLLAGAAHAQSFWTGGAGDGNWETGGNWTPGTPMATDAAVFSDTVANANATITAGGNDQTIQDLLINTSGNQDYAGTITIDTGRMLTVRDLIWTDDATLDNPTLSVVGTLVIQRTATLTTITGNRITNSGTIRFTNTSGATQTWSSSAITSWGNVDVNVGSQLDTGSNLTVTDLTVSGGTFTVPTGTLTVTGNLTVANGAVLLVNGGTLNVTGTTTVTGTGDLQVSSGSVTLTGGITGTGNLSVSGGTVNLPAFSLTGTVTHSAGTIAFTAATVNLANTTAYTSSGTAAATFSGTTTLVVDGNVSFVGATFSGGPCFMSGGGLNLTGTLTLNTGLTLAGASSIGTLAIDTAGDTLTLGGGTCTVTTVGTFAGGSIVLSGQTLNVTTGFTMASGTINDSDNAASILDVDTTTFAPTGGAGVLDMSHGTMRFSGTTLTFTNLGTVGFASAGVLRLDRSGGNQTVTLKAATNLRDLQVARAAIGELVTFASVAPQIQGATTISGGTLDVTLNNTTFAGAVTVQSGAELRCVTASRTTIFQSTVDVAGTLRFGNAAASSIVVQFAAGSGNRVRVTTGGQFLVAGDLGGGANNTRRVFLSQDGTSGGAQWFLDYSNPGGGTASVSRARIQDGNANPLTVATDGSSLDGANNTNWATSANTLTWDNGGGTGLWSNAANWVENAVPQSGDTVVFSAVGGTSTVDVAGLTLASMDMTNFTGTLVQSQTLSVTGALTVVGTAYTMNAALTVGGTFTHTSGTLTTNAFLLTLSASVELDATLTVSGGGTLACGSIASTSGGTLNGTGTVNFSGTSYDFSNLNLDLTGGTTTFTANGVALTSGGAASDEFFNVVLNLAGGSFAVTGPFLTQAGGGISVTAGNLSLANAANVIGTGGVDVNAGTFSIAGGTTQVAGGWDLTGAAGFTPNSSTVELNGGGAQAIVPAGRAFSSVTKTGAGAASVTGPVTINGNLTVSAGSFDVTGTCAIAGTTGLTASGGSYSATGATTITGTGADLLISGGAVVTLGNAANTINDAMTLSNGMLLGNGGGSLSLGGNWNTTGATTTFTPNGLTVTLTGGNPQTITQADDPFGNLTCNKSGNTASVSNLNVTGTLQVSGGTLQPSNAPTALGAAVTINGGTLSSNGQTFSITPAVTLSSGSLAVTTGGTVTLSGGATGAGTITVAAGALTFGTGVTTGLTGTVTLTSGTLNLPNATNDLTGLTALTGGSSTTTVSGGTLRVKSGVSFNNLTIQTAAVTLTGSTAGLSVGGALALNTGLTLAGGNASAGSLSGSGALGMSGLNLTISGSFSHTGTITTGVGTLQLDGSDANVVVDGTVNLDTGVLILTNGVSNTDNGTLTVGSGDLRVGGTNADFSGFAAVTFTTGTLTFIGSGAQSPNLSGVTVQNLTLSKNASANTVTLAAGTVNGAVMITTGTLNLTANRTFSGAVTIGTNGVLFTTDADRSVTFGSTLSIAGILDFDQGDNNCALIFTPGQTVTVQSTGQFLINGGSSGGNQTDLHSVTAGVQWTMVVVSGGTVSVTDANIRDASVSPSQNAGSSTNQGNNTGWVFDPKTTTWDNGNLTGLWSDDLNWDQGAPTTGDTVAFTAVGGTSRVDIAGLSLAAMDMSGFTGALEQDNALTFTGNVTVAGMAYNMNMGTGLTVGGTLTLANGCTLSTGTGTLTVTGTTTVSGVLASALNGTVDLNGDLVGGGAGTRQISMGAGTLRLGGANVTFTNLAGGLTSSGATFFDRGSAQAVALRSGLSFQDVTQTSGSVITVSGTAGFSASGTFQVNANLNLGGGASTVGTLDLVSGTVDQNGQNLTAGTFTGASGTNVITDAGTFNVTTSFTSLGTLSPTTGVLDVDASITTASTGTFTMGSGTLQVSGATVNLSAATVSWTSGTLTFDAAGAQTFTPAASNLNNLTLTKSVIGDLVSLAAGTTVGGNLTLTTGTLGLPAGQTLNVSGNVSSAAAGALSVGSGTIVVTGTTTWGGSLSGGTGVVDLDGNVSGTGSIAMQTGLLRCSAATVDLGSLTLGFAAGGNLTLDGSGNQALTLGAATLQAFTISKGAAGDVVTLGGTGTTSVAGTTSITTGILALTKAVNFSAISIASGTVLRNTTAPSLSYQFNGNVTLNGEFRFEQSSLILSFGGGVTLTMGGAGSSFIITGGLGASRITLRQDGAAGAPQWNLTRAAGDTVSVNNARIQDGFVSASTIALSSVDDGGNTNWVFGPKTTTWTNASALDDLWSNDGNWDNDRPADGDVVNFSAVGGTSNLDLAGLDLTTLNMSGYTGTLTMNNGLHVTGVTTLAGTVATNAQALILDGACTVNTGGNLQTSSLVSVGGDLRVNGTLSGLVGGVVNVTGNYLAASTGTIAMVNQALTVSGVTVNLATTTWTSGVLQLTGGNAQSLTPPGGTISTLTVTKTAATVATLAASGGVGVLNLNSGNLDLGGTTLTTNGAANVLAGTVLTMAAGTLQAGGTAELDGQVQITGAGALDLNGNPSLAVTSTGNLSLGAGNLRCAGDTNLSGLAALTFTSGGVILDGASSPQSFTPTAGALGNLTLQKNAAGNLVNLQAGLGVSGALTVTTGTLGIGAQTVTLSGAGTPFSLGANGSFTMGAAGTVSYTSTGGVTVLASSYAGNLQIGSGAAGTFTIGTGSVAGTLTLAANATFNVTDLTLSGAPTPLAGTGVFGTGSGVVRYTNAGAVTVAATTFPGLTLQNGSFNVAGNVTAALDLTVTGATLTPGATQLVAQRLLGTGTVNLAGTSLRLTGSTNPFQVSNLQNLLTSTVIYAGNSPQVRSADAPNFTYGNLTLSGGGTATLTGGSAMYVAGNLSFQVNSTFAGTVQFEPGAATTTFACGSSIVNLAGLVLNKSVASNTVSLTGADFILRTIANLTLTKGTLDVACDVTIVQGTIGTAGLPGDDAQLVVNTSGVDLTVGDGTNRTLTVNDVMRFGQGATDLRLFLAAAPGPTRANLVLGDPNASLAFLGLSNNQMRIDSTSTPVQGLITRSQANANASITALHVSVIDNDASGVLGPGGTQSPIQAQGISVDRGNNLNWTFTGGGALRIIGATVLGDGSGSIDRVRLAYSLPIDPATVGDVFQRFTLRQQGANPNDPPLLSITGTSASVAPSQSDNVLEVRFGSGVAKTDVTGLELRYSPPTSNQLASDTGIPAAQSETISTSTSPPLSDGAAPVVIGTFFQDVDQNGGLDRMNLFCSEPVAFSAARGTSVSGFQPVTTTTDLGGNTSLTLRIAGEDPVTINLTPGGIPRLTGAAMAQRIQDAVRFLVSNTPPAITNHDPLKRPAYSNFTCQFTGGRYLLRAGVPLLFDTGTSSYRQDWAGSTVQVVAGGADAAPQLKLGAANGGVERAGSGDARTGLSVSGAVNPDTLTVMASTNATLKIDGENFRSYAYTSDTTSLENVALVLEGLVRAGSNEALSPPNQPGYSEFVAVPDRARGRLVFVSGAPGPGSRVEFASSGDPFATVARVGSANLGAGASEPAGAANTTVSLADLSVRGQDGANLLQGLTSADLTIAGSVVVVTLSNVAGSGLATPTFNFADDGDGGFLCDRALVYNVASSGATNLPAGNPLVLVGDTDGDGALSVSPGAVLLDAVQSVLPLGGQGVTASWSWSFLSGPGPITINGLSTFAPQNDVSTSPSFTFSARTATTGGNPYTFRLVVTLLDGNGQPVVNAFTDGNGQIVSLVTVDVTEDAPVAVIAAGQVVIAASLQVDASGSFDPNGGAITWSWSAVDALGLPLGPTAFDDFTLAKPLFTPGKAGPFTVTVTVSKVVDTSLTASASTQVTLVDSSNFPPHADAGPDAAARVNITYQLDGSGSVDPETTQLTYAWSPLSLAAPAVLSDPQGVRPTFTPTVPGSYVWRLTVTDATGQSSSDTVTVVVQDDLAAQPRLGPAAEPRAAGLRRSAFLSQAPTISNGTLPVLILERGVERQVTRVDVASDPNDDPAPGSTTGLLVAHAVVGNALFASYYATPMTGDGEPVAIRFAVGQDPVPLVAYGVTGQSFVLDGTRSQDDGVITSYSWKQISGPFQFDTRTGNLLAVVPQSAGTYVFQLTVTDNVGLTSLPRQIAIPVVPAGNTAVGPPAILVNAPGGSVVAPARVLPALTVTGSAGAGISLNASGSSSRNAGALTFRWVQVSGALASLTGADTGTLGVVAKVPGPLLFKVTITDQNGVSTSELVWVTVGAPGKDAPVARISEVPDQTLTTGSSLELTLQSGSSSGDGPLQYRWSQGRGVLLVIDDAVGGVARVSVTQPGIYEISLQVVDANGVLSAPATETFEVIGTGDQALASGSSFKKSSGGCALGAGEARGGLAGVLLLGLGLLLLRRRRA